MELIEKIPDSIARAPAADQEWYVVHVLTLVHLTFLRLQPNRELVRL